MEVIEVTDKELAEYLGVSDRRVRMMVGEGIVVKVKAGRYDLKASVINYINAMKAAQKKNEESMDKIKLAKEAEGLTHERLKKRKTELQVLQLERKMHMQEDVEFFWNAMVVAAKGRISAIPVKVAPLIVGIEDRKEAQAILKREIDDALNELADYDIDQFDNEYDVLDEDEE